MNCEVCKNKANKRLINHGSYSILKCSNCGLVYVNPLPTEQEIASFYENFAFTETQKTNAELYEDILYARAKRLFTKLRLSSSGKTSKTLLDIGCNIGNYLRVARDIGFNVFGVELDNEAVRYAREKYALNVFKGTLEASEFPDNYFDFVMFKHVIEHLRRPREMLLDIYKRMKKGGILYCQTPNTESLEHIAKHNFHSEAVKIKQHNHNLSLIKSLIKVIRREWGYVDPPRHLYGFNTRNLTILLKETGFRTIYTFTATSYDRTYSTFPSIPEKTRSLSEFVNNYKRLGFRSSIDNYLIFNIFGFVAQTIGKGGHIINISVKT